ncbi:HAMP domain-containing protein [Kitasatospora sp. NPDC004240]
MSTPSAPRQHRSRRRADMPLLGGIRPPIVLLLVLLVAVAAVTALAVGGLRVDDTPRTVREAHRYAAEDTADTLRARVREGVADLRRAAARHDHAPAEPAAVLTELTTAYRKWRGVAIVHPGTGRLLATRGETVPLTGLDLTQVTDTAPAPLLVPSASGPRLLTFALVETAADGRALLIASDSLRLAGTAVRKGQTLQVLDRTGAALDSVGVAPTAEPDKRVTALAHERAAGQRPTPGRAVSGDLAGPPDDKGARRLAGYAAVASADSADPANRLGLTVVSSSGVNGTPGTLRHPALGFAAAGALLALALLLLLFLRRTVQRPLLRLYLAARRLTRGELDEPVTGPRRGEAGRITRALEELRRQLLDPSGPPATPARRRRGPGIALPLAFCAVVILGWSGPLLFLGGADGTARVPDQVVAAQGARTEATADRVRQALNEGRADLRSLAPALAGALADPSPERAESVLRTALAEHGRYRSLYVLDTRGQVVALAGDEPYRTGREAVGPSGVLLLNRSGKEPRIAARAVIGESADADAGSDSGTGTGTDGGPASPSPASPSPASPSPASPSPAAPTVGAPAPATGGGTGTPSGPVVIGELRTEFLNGLLDRPGLGRVWLVDDRRRLLGANEAFSSFGDLPEPRARDLAADAGRKPAADVVRTGGAPVLLAAAPLGGGGSVRDLGWSVVTAHPVAWLDLDQNRADRRAVLSGMLGLAAATLCLGWLFIVVGLPLRRLADAAQALAAGDRRTVLHPVHHDEVGAVARSLELIRQDLEEAARNTPSRPHPPVPAPDRTAASGPPAATAR